MLRNLYIAIFCLLGTNILNAQKLSFSLTEGINIPMKTFKNEVMFSFPSLGVNVTTGADYMFNHIVGLGISAGYVYFYNNVDESTEQLASISNVGVGRSAGKVAGGDYHMFKYI